MIEIITANLLWIVVITIGGALISQSVHFVPVGGAPAAMAQATGIGTGTVQLAAGAGLTGLVSAAYMMNVTDEFPSNHCFCGSRCNDHASIHHDCRKLGLRLWCGLCTCICKGKG